MAQPGALATIDPEPIVAALKAGQSLRQIAATLGVSNVGLRAWLLREDAETYADAITGALTTRVAEADEELETASDAISIARAREIARFARMDLERRRPALYGQRSHVTVENVGDLGERLRRARERVVSDQQAQDVAHTPLQAPSE